MNATYKGVHEYGKRTSSRDKSLIVRSVPAIVPEDLWNRAQQALSNHFLFGRRNAKKQYLLRGLLKCQRCGLTYIEPVRRVQAERWSSTTAATARTMHGRSSVQIRSGAVQKM
jgi:hypothetical protein